MESMQSGILGYLTGRAAAGVAADGLSRYLADAEDEEPVKIHPGTGTPCNAKSPDACPYNQSAEKAEQLDKAKQKAEPAEEKPAAEEQKPADGGQEEPAKKEPKPYKPNKRKAGKSTTLSAISARKLRRDASPEELELIRERERLREKRRLAKLNGGEFSEEDAARIGEITEKLRKGKGEIKKSSIAQRERVKALLAKISPEEREVRKKLNALNFARYNYSLDPRKVSEIDKQIAETKKVLEGLVAARGGRGSKNKYPSRNKVLFSKKAYALYSKLQVLKARLKDAIAECEGYDPVLGASGDSKKVMAVNALEKKIRDVTQKFKEQKQKDTDELNEKEKRGIIERRTYSEKGHDVTVQWNNGRWPIVETTMPQDMLERKKSETAQRNKERREQKKAEIAKENERADMARSLAGELGISAGSCRMLIDEYRSEMGSKDFNPDAFKKWYNESGYAPGGDDEGGVSSEGEDPDDNDWMFGSSEDQSPAGIYLKAVAEDEMEKEIENNEETLKRLKNLLAEVDEVLEDAGFSEEDEEEVAMEELERELDEDPEAFFKKYGELE